MTLLDLHTTTSPDDTLDFDDYLADHTIGHSIEVADGVIEAQERTGTRYARCADGNGTLTHLFFSDDEFDIARAKAICSRCGLAPECLGGALDRAEPYGVWGGELLVEGVIVSVKRGRGRPPKTPRAPLVVDEVPSPPHLVA
jgi:WhiB family redox-sensing transcriptional regulator